MSGQRPSTLAGLNEEYDESDPLLLDFDIACTMRLDLYDRDCRQQQAVQIANEVGRMLFSDE